MGLKGIYLVLHTFRGSQAQCSALCHLIFKGGRLANLSLETCAQKKLETIILSSRVWGIKGPLQKRGVRGELSVTSAMYWDIPEKARIGQQKNDSNRLERRKIPFRYSESSCPGGPLDFLLWGMLQTQPEKAIYNMAKNSDLDLTSKLALVWARVWVKCHQRCFLTYIIA